MVGLLGKKLRMTQIYNEAMEVIPVTVLEAGPCHVLQVREPERDGYRAVQVGFADRKKNVRKPQAGHAAKAGVSDKRFIREFRTKEGEEFKAGQAVTVEVFEGVRKVDVAATSKGKGFQGVMKRHHFKGGPLSHGSKNLREPGSTGMHTDPGRVLKGKKMPGQMGNERVTVKNLPLIRIDKEQNLLFVKGAVPGPNGGFVEIRASRIPTPKKKV